MKDFLLNRICSGTILLRHGQKKYFYKQPSIDVKYEADTIEEENITDNIEILTRNEAIDYLIEIGKWDIFKDKEIEDQIPKSLEDLKLNLYISYAKDRKNIEKYKEKISIVKTRLMELLSIKHSLDEYTIEGLARRKKNLFLLKKGIKKLDIYPNQLLNSFYSSFLDESDIRYVARMHEWESKWCVIKKGFKVFSDVFTEEQERLIRWTLIYENIKEDEKPPPDEIFKDDDAFDGYLIFRDKEKNDSDFLQKLENKLSKAGIKYNELYLPASNMEEALRNDSLNTPEAKRIKEQRFKDMEGRDVIKELQFSDQQVKLQLMKNQLEAGRKK